MPRGAKTNVVELEELGGQSLGQIPLDSSLLASKKLSHFLQGSCSQAMKAVVGEERKVEELGAECSWADDMAERIIGSAPLAALHRVWGV